MLTPEYLEDLPEEILRLFYDVEQEILADMARRVSTYDFWIPAAEYQRQKLREAGVLQDDILKALSGLTGRSEKELKRLMQEAGTKALQSDTAVYEAAGMTVPKISDSEPLRAILNAGFKATAQTMRNLCQTTARTATMQFENALDLAWLKVQSGAFGTDSAVRSAIKELTQRGIQSIRYPSGRTDSIEVAVRRAVVTGVNQTAGQLQEELADELGCDLVEVSAHAGARPEHAVWQGKIYSRSGNDPKYPLFRKSTGYGTGAGLCGWNCRHTFGPYIEGSPPVWSEEQLAELDAPKYEYNGKKLTEYEASQQQRYNERQIRRWKREYTSMEAAGLDTAESSLNLRHWQETQNDFLSKTGFKRQYARETSIGFSKRQASKAYAESAYVEREANRIFSLGSTDKNIKMFLKEKPLIDLLASHGVQYIQRISNDEIIVDAGKPQIVSMRQHAVDNLFTRPDRKDMSVEQAQLFVDNAKLTIYQVMRESIKFLAQDGYAVLNFQNELVTAVPQKWRKKYDKFIGGDSP